MRTIGERLRDERKRLGMNQDDFAAVGGVKKGAQITYEKDERQPDAGFLAAVAVIGVDVLYVLTGTRTPAPAGSLTLEERALLDNYHHADPEGQAAARRILDALAQQELHRKSA